MKLYVQNAQKDMFASKVKVWYYKKGIGVMETKFINVKIMKKTARGVKKKIYVKKDIQDHYVKTVIYIMNVVMEDIFNQISMNVNHVIVNLMLFSKFWV